MRSMSTPASTSQAVTIVTTLQPGDIGEIVRLHGVLYAAEQGWDHTFEAYVAGPLAEFALAASDRERIWIARLGGRIVGCIAIVSGGDLVAQLRWFLVDSSVRGSGLGRTLLEDAVAFCRSSGSAWSSGSPAIAGASTSWRKNMSWCSEAVR